MFQVPENLLLPTISADIPKGKSSRFTEAHKSLQAAFKDSNWKETSHGQKVTEAPVSKIATLQKTGHPQRMRGIMRTSSLTQAYKGLI